MNSSRVLSTQVLLNKEYVLSQEGNRNKGLVMLNDEDWRTSQNHFVKQTTIYSLLNYDVCFKLLSQVSNVNGNWKINVLQMETLQWS